MAGNGPFSDGSGGWLACSKLAEEELAADRQAQRDACGTIIISHARNNCKCKGPNGDDAPDLPFLSQMEKQVERVTQARLIARNKEKLTCQMHDRQLQMQLLWRQ